MNVKPFIQGFTTNPSLMNKAGIRNYKAFALDILSEIKNEPISFEVFSDDFDAMERQAKKSPVGQVIFMLKYLLLIKYKAAR